MSRGMAPRCRTPRVGVVEVAVDAERPAVVLNERGDQPGLV